MSIKKVDTTSPHSSQTELDNRKQLQTLFSKNPLQDELLDNLSLFMTRQSLMRVFFFQELYELIVNTHGVIVEFGCRWGTNMSLFTALRGIYEPYNHNRKIIGFDTFSGLKGVSGKDSNSKFIEEGFVSTGKNYDKFLEQILSCLEQECPIQQIKKHEIIKGDVCKTLPMYLKKNPQTVIALAYFDMDIYKPTKAALEMIMPHVTKGSIIAIDEMNWSEMPGPTLAFNEVIGIGKYKIVHSPLQPIPGYIVIE